MARTRLYREGELVLADFPAEYISEYLKDPRACVWLDYCDPTKAELATIDPQPHDVPMDLIVTERRVLRFAR